MITLYYVSLLGPREPWHDIHCELNGPIAHDVFMNFYERWLRQCIKYGRLDPIDTSRIDVMDSVPHTYPWRCQIFRSITSDSALFEFHRSKVLSAKKGRMVDASIGKIIPSDVENLKSIIFIVQGDPHQNLLFEMAFTVKIFIPDPLLLKPKCSSEAEVCLHFYQL